jgi:hypothetical protein
MIKNGRRYGLPHSDRGDLGLDNLPGKNHIFKKKQNRIGYGKVSFAEIFLCFRGLKMIVTIKMKFMVQPWG